MAFRDDRFIKYEIYVPNTFIKGSYTTTDTMATVTGAGYFNNMYEYLRGKPIILDVYILGVDASSTNAELVKEAHKIILWPLKDSVTGITSVAYKSTVY